MQSSNINLFTFLKAHFGNSAENAWGIEAGDHLGSYYGSLCGKK